MESATEGLPVKDSLTVVLAHRTRCDRGLHLAIEMGGKHGAIELLQGMSRDEVVASLRALADQIQSDTMNAHGHGPLANQAILDAGGTPQDPPSSRASQSV
jgi:hypothetical protein